MLICIHRVNESKKLLEIPSNYGVEIDLRTYHGEVVVQHDIFSDGEPFTKWLKSFHHKFLIINVKEEGLEVTINKLLDSYSIKDWAYLDQSFPYLVKELLQGNTKTMVRVSEFEDIQTAKNFASASFVEKPDWIWLDSFMGNYPNSGDIQELDGLGYRFMVVSPELQGRHDQSEIQKVKDAFFKAGVKITGVCTKEPKLWV